MNRFAAKIVAALATVQGSSIASIDTETQVTLKGGKKNPMQGRVTKRTEGGNIMLFTNSNSNAYDNMVRRRLAAEGKNPNDFKLSPRTWGVRVTDTPFVEHKGQLYVEAIYLNPPKVVKYFLDGVETAKSAIIGLEDREESAQGGLSEENKVPLRVYKLESIKCLRMGGNSVIPV